MKKIAVSAGLVAFGAAGIQTAMAAVSDVISPKAWNIGVTLRAFYDDNYAIGTTSKGSGGFEISPTVSVNIPLRQTDLGFRYTYGLYYYQDRQDIGVTPIDQTHQFEVWMDHKFNTRWHLNATDSFAVGQEPELLQSSTSQPFRTKGDNIANHASISLETQWTHNFNTSFHYGNTFFDYEAAGATPMLIVPTLAGLQAVGYSPATPGFNDGFFRSVAPSLAGSLNRVEQNAGIDFSWVLQSETMLSVGYNFSLANYTGGEDIAAFNFADTTPAFRSLVYRSDSRDTMSHYVYLGLQHQFTANISGSARVGAGYTDSYNNPLSHDTSISPYADISISYTYIPGSYVQFGVTHDINATDVVQPNATSGKITSYQESSVVYASLNHKFNQDLIGTIIGRFQNSTYHGGANENQNDQSYGVGINLHYQINQHFSTEVGYNFDDLVSGLNGRSYDRNRVYLGVSATY